MNGISFPSSVRRSSEGCTRAAKANLIITNGPGPPDEAAGERPEHPSSLDADLARNLCEPLLELFRKMNVPALSVDPALPGADHGSNLPADVARHLLEPLMGLVELGKATEPPLSVVPALIKEIEAHPDRVDRTQIGIRKFFLKKITDEEASGGGAIGPTTKELAKLGAHLASLVATLRTNLPVTASRLADDEASRLDGEKADDRNVNR